MKEFTDSITEFLGPIGSSALGQAIIGLLILIVGMFGVRFFTNIAVRAMRKIPILNRKSSGDGSSDLATPLGSLIKAVLTIFVVMAVLQHFGLTDVLAPLQQMANEFALAVPNIIGAGVIGYAGWMIAKIVSDIAGIALTKVDAKIGERTGQSDIRIAPFGKAFIFGSILLPITVAALGVLNIPAISDPASSMIQDLMAAVPSIIGAGIILLVTYFVARFVIYMLTGLLKGMNIDSLPSKLGIEGLFSDSFTPTRLVGGAVMFFSMLTAATAAVDVLGIEIVSTIFGRVLEFGGGILVGGLILIIGNFLGKLAHDKLTAGGSAGLAKIARIAILGLVLAMGLKSMGLADHIVNMAFGFTIGSVAVAIALAFGQGGKDAAKQISDSWAAKIIQK